MATSDEIKRKALELSEKTDSNSISPKEVGGIMHDLASLGENAIRNGGTLGIRKVYTSVSVMEADKNPKDFWGNPMKKGNLVLIYDGTTTGLDNNKIYVYMNPGWEFATYLDAGYPTRQEFSELGSEQVFIVGEGSSGANAGVTKEGDCYLSIESGLLRKCVKFDSSDKNNNKFETLSYVLNGIYIFKEKLYRWDGQSLVLATSENVKFDVFVGYAIKSSMPTESSLYSYSSPILLKEGQTIRVNLIGGDVWAISETDMSGSTYTELVEANSSTKFKEYAYTANKDMYVALCWKNIASYKPIEVTMDDVLGIKEKISSLSSEVMYFQDSLDAEYTSIRGYYIYGSIPSANSDYSYTSPISLSKGECIVTRLKAKGAWAISKTDKDGSAYEKLVSGIDVNNYNDYKYIATEDCYVSVCWRSASHLDLPFVKIVQNKSMEAVVELREELEVPCIFNYEIGSLNTKGENATAENRARTSFINAEVSYQLVPLDGKVSLRFYDKNKNFISGTEWLSSYVDLKKIAPSGCKFARVVFAYKDDRAIASVSEVESLCKITTVSFVHAINELKELISQNNDKDLEIFPTWNRGSYINEDGIISSSSSYQYSDPLNIEAGTEIRLITSGKAFYGISKYVGGTYEGLLFCNPEKSDQVVEYKYYLTETADIVFCVKNTNEYSVSLQTDIGTDDNLTNSNSNTGNISIVAAKEHHYSDGTYPVIEWFLVKEPLTNKFYYSKDLTSKSFLFGFNNHDKYSFGIMPNGDIIAVRLAESLPLTSSEANRVNPFVIKASENWKVVHEVDFKDKLKPCGWLENCGFCALPNGDTMFCEYTRISVETCNVWKITGDPLDANNWNVKKTFALSGEEDAGLKHLHAVRNDPFTGFVYISTGDYEASSIYVSKDNGETFAPVLENNESLCRSLEITFTKDYVYYANDSTKHIFVKAPRNNEGVIDLENAQTIVIPKTEGAALACYGQSYIPEFNACFIFDRQDGGGSVTKYPLYIVDLETLECYKVGSIEGLNLTFGFRTIFSEWYPNNATIRLGFSFSGKARNSIKTCGNKLTKTDGSKSINNLVIHLYRNGNAYSMKISTIYL